MGPGEWDHEGVSDTTGRSEAGAPPTTEAATATAADHICLAEQWVASNYHPLPVVISHAEGVWVTDVDGRRYLDALAGYSALNFGHLNPTLMGVAREQLDRLTLTSRAFHSDRLGPFCRDLAALAGKELVLPMNTGAEAVETAIKVARKWGYEVKGVPDGKARIVVMGGNFHGRTTTIISFSDDPVAHDHYGPYTPGFDTVPFGDITALEAAITDDTVAVLLEPIQGEGGVILPPAGWLAAVRELTRSRNVLMIADEIQSGLGRTGTTFACDLDDVVPDVYVLGKALGGGIVPVSAVVADRTVLGVLTPGTHGSTFGGNPLAAAVGQAVVGLLRTGEFQDRTQRLGKVLGDGLDGLVGNGVAAVRRRGLWAGVDIEPDLMTGREASRRLLACGVLVKDTHGSTVRIAPPLVIEEPEVELLVDAFRTILH